MAHKILGVRAGDWESRRQSQGLFNITRETRTIVYTILADSVNATDTDIYNNTPNLPQINGTIAGLNGRIKTVDINEVEPNSRIWEAIFELDSAQQFVVPGPPDQLPPEWSWGVEFEERVMEQDVRDIPVETSAGEQIVHGVPYPIPVLNISRIQTTFDPDTIYSLVNTINLTPFWGASKGNVLCSGISDMKETIDDVDYRKVNYTFKFKILWEYDKGAGTWDQAENGWWLELMDYGTYYYKLNNIKPENKRKFRLPKDATEEAGEVFDYTGSPTEGKLNGIGDYRDPDNPPVSPNDDFRRYVDKDGDPLNAVYIRLQPYPYAEFNAYNLGPF